MKIRPHKNFENIFLVDGKFATRNLTPGKSVYGEKRVKSSGEEYRIWDIYRSKPAAALKKKIKRFPLEPGSTVLYLGIASGTTASHFSDIVEEDGIIYGVEIAERVLRDLMPHAEKRGNIVPILADSRRPETYEKNVMGRVDLIYEDVASKDQIPIMLRNAEIFLRSGGYAMIAIKSQSIDVTKKPRKIYKQCLKGLEEKFEILDRVELDPYEKMHLFVVMKYKE